MANNKQIAKDVLAAVGGKDNVSQAQHCMTRLRLNLKDAGIPSEDAIKKIPGVLGVMEAGGQYQIIIGPNVAQVYTEFCKIADLNEEAAIDENLDAGLTKLTPKKVGANILNYITGSMTPMIVAMMSAGLCKALAAVIGPEMLNIVGETDNIYIMLNFMYSGFYYFLPIMIGFNAARKLDMPAHLGAVMGGILVSPGFMDIVNAGEPFDIFGIDVPLVNYSQSMVPVLLSVAFMGLLYRIFTRFTPDVLATVFTPFLTLLIAAPVSLICLAPLGNIVGGALGGALAAFSQATGFIGVGLIGALWGFLVMTGMHVAVLMPFLADFLAKGYQSGAILGGVANSFASMGVCVGAFLYFKNKREKADALGFFLSSFVGGVGEPIVYGLLMEYKRCWLGVLAGGFVGGAFLGITNVAQYVLVTASNFLQLLGFTGGSTFNLVCGLLGALIAFVVSAVVTYFFGFAKGEVKEADEIAA